MAAPNAPSQDIKDILVSASIGTFAATSGWGIYISKEPDTPDTVVTIYDVGGLVPNPKWLIEEPSVHVRIRGAVFGYTAAWTKAQAVKDALLGLTPQTVNGTAYKGVLAIGDLSFINYDENNRPIITQNWRIIREPAEGTYRTAL